MKGGLCVYYFLILIAVVLFGGNFLLHDIYRVMRGNSLKISLQFTAVSSLGGLLILFISNRGEISFTLFTLIMAILSSINGIAFTFCGFKALGKINLSMYSLYSMLGGMLLPFLQGIIFYGENITLAKIICCTLIIVSLLLTLDRNRISGGEWYYAGIFILNGMSGVLTKLFTSLDFPKADATSFSILTALTTLVIALISLLFFNKKKDTSKISIASVGISIAGGVTSRIANLQLVIALLHIETSAQYPLVTGGVIIISTIVSFFKKNKPTIKELVSVLLAFLGLVAMFIIPI